MDGRKLSPSKKALAIRRSQVFLGFENLGHKQKGPQLRADL
jgi:hypothetical protein